MNPRTFSVRAERWPPDESQVLAAGGRAVQVRDLLERRAFIVLFVRKLLLLVTSRECWLFVPKDVTP